MATEKDLNFVEFVLQQTADDKIQWESTADPQKFTVSLKGKYKVTIDRGSDNNDNFYHWLTLLDESDRELLTVYGRESHSVARLFDLAKRNSLNVDQALDEIMSGEPEGGGSPAPITDKDIPF
ncbi:MAG: hypothetical protein WCA49_01410 [Candidatus Sulfotelmatobacter sp.]